MKDIRYGLVSVSEDAHSRWQAGRLAFGDQEWVGKDPLWEAYEEALDLLNYLTEDRYRHSRDRDVHQWDTMMLVKASLLADAIRVELISRKVVDA